MKAVLKSFCCISLLLVFFTTAFAQTSTPHVLFVLSAGKGHLKQMNKGYTLSLKKVDEHVLWFTDRPYRKAGVILTPKFIANWDTMFKSSQPNVAVVHAGMKAMINGKMEAEALELSHPVWHKNTLKFTVGKLKGDSIVPGKMKHIRLFIDSVGSRSFWGGPTA